MANYFVALPTFLHNPIQIPKSLESRGTPSSTRDTMDIQDVSQDAHYAQMVQTQKARLEAARARKGERPTDRQTRQELAEQHMIQHEDMMALKASGRKDTYMRATMIGDPYLPSIAPLTELKKIMIKELALETHHRGSYLLLRFFVPPIRMTGMLCPFP